MKNSIIAVLICLIIGFAFGYQVKKYLEVKQEPIILVDTIRDTTIVARVVPSERIVRVVDTITRFVHNNDTVTLRDTIYKNVYIPTSDYTFENSDAKVKVNGYDVRLINFESYRKTKIIKRQPKWSIGVGLGYGFGRNGPSPNISISVNRVLFSW